MAKNKAYRIEVPELDYFEQRFAFVKNATLRTNLSISLQYITFLIKVETELATTGAVEYSIFKNIVQYTASIVEGIMHYGLEYAIKHKIVLESHVMPRSEKFSEMKMLYKIDDHAAIMGVKRIRRFEKLKKNTQFRTICDAYRKGKLMSSSLIQAVNNLREKRNRIHLAGLTKVENYYNKDDINNAFETANQVITRIEDIIVNNPT